MDVINYFFGWYTGQIWGNLIASIITAALVWIFGFRKLFKIHRQHQAQIHNHITQEFAKLTEELNK